MPNRNSRAQWLQVSELIAARTGLNFPRERWRDLERGIAGAAREFGFPSTAECVDWLLSRPLSKAQLQVLAGHLTIGETYFFRDRAVWTALAQNVLPELIRERRNRSQRLRIWSAAGCSGEEPYSLAILLRELLPDLQEWQVTIIATDVNTRFLSKAAAGIYREWSFRNAPPGVKERYFNRTPAGDYEIRPEIKKLVTFSYLNLVEDAYPSLLNETNAMDVVFCRNVLMYFTPAQVRKVVRNLHHALVDGGWLVVSPSEASQAVFHEFATVNYPGVILYRKGSRGAAPERARTARFPVETSGWRPALDKPAARALEPHGVTARVAAPEMNRPSETVRETRTRAEAMYDEGRYAEAADTLLAGMAERPGTPAEFSLLTRALANQGRLADALTWCERWLEADKLDPAGHYLRAIVLLEQGDTAAARASLQRSIYLRSDFVLAHFALGNLGRIRGEEAEAAKHFRNALRLLRAHKPDEVLPESEGLTAGRLAEIISATAAMESAP